MRDRITFKCSVCGEENYIGTRNKKKHPERMTLKNIVQNAISRLNIRRKVRKTVLFGLFYVLDYESTSTTLRTRTG